MYIEITDGKYKGLRGYVKNWYAGKVQAYLYKDCEGFDVYRIPNGCIRVIEPSELLYDAV